METFGDRFKRLRIRSGKSLRAFCLQHSLDPGNMSKLERGRLAPPESDLILEQYATWLGLKRGTEEWTAFFDSAAAERGRIPSDLLTDDELVQKLPVLFRVLRGTDAGHGLDQLIEKIRKA